MLNLVDKMEANLHLNTNVLLPPRKRLLAGLKKRNSDGDGGGDGFSVSKTSGPAETDTRIEESLRSSLNRSDEEIVEASLSALATAVKLAKEKRVVAEQKAEAAAKAISAAKDALELMAIMSEESRRKPRCMKKKKQKKKKKQVPVVQNLYNKERSVENVNTDEELARKLHQAMNSSPRISKNSPPSDSRRFEHGKLVCKKNEADYKFVQSGEETKPFISLYGRPPKTVIKLLMDKPFYPSSTSAEKRSKIEQINVPLSICPNSKNEPITTTTTTTTTIEPIWKKCGEFKTSVCVKQDKAVESSS